VGAKLQESPEAQWLAQLYSTLQLTSDPEDPQNGPWLKNGTKTVGGKTCTIYLNPQGWCCHQTLCVDDDGKILSTIFRQKFNETPPRAMITTSTLTHFTDEGDLTPPTGCVDLTGTQGPPGIDWEKTDANDAELIRKANEEAAGAWVAEASSVFEGMSLAEAAKRHGTRMAVPRLPPRPTESSVGDAEIPDSFDSRDHWKNCKSIGSIRNQGSCGSCWAFAANEAFADRLCIGGGSKDFTGGVEYMLDCDKDDSACQGGFLDDAWEFLQKTGIPDEKCDPYKYCKNPADPQCKPKVSPAFRAAPPAQPTCPSKCKDGLALDLKKAKSAYMVAKPGDVKGMQKEIMTNGPIEVAFFVYSDFQTYKSGVYSRTPSAQGPEGGHAVRILGWGKEQGTDYGLVANSWSPEWGDHGYFKIRRGTNECGIETIPAAGLAEVSVTEIVV